ncbi:MAG: hypothetical protein OHK93_000686 [Ramalina farinacea]|uniref:Uncharacterized protein n=1 Tax=Ramalina farinacea TaxID=258253 RepID=A0AA43QFD9_9LECA|nr:hypothetical protein [Ramalina farinacea]
MSTHHTPHDFDGEEDDDDPWTHMTALSRDQTFHSFGTLSPMPAANHTSLIINSPANINREPDTSRHYHGTYNPALVTVRQQQDGGQPPLQPSLESPITSWDFRHPQGAASTAHPRPHHHHVDGIQQDPSDAQGGWRTADALPPQLRADYALYESRRHQGGSSMLSANMPYLGYRNIYESGQSDGTITHTAVGNANDGIRDVRSSNQDFSSQLELLGSAMMRFDGNTTMNMGITAPPGDPSFAVISIIPEEENTIFQTPWVNTGYEPSGVPTYDTHTYSQPSEALTPTHPVHRPLQPLHRNPHEGSLNERRYLGSTSASTHGQPPRRDTPSRRSRPRKERKLATPSDYEKDRKAHVKTHNLACDLCKARKIGVRL